MTPYHLCLYFSTFLHSDILFLGQANHGEPEQGRQVVDGQRGLQRGRGDDTLLRSAWLQAVHLREAHQIRLQGEKEKYNLVLDFELFQLYLLYSSSHEKM